ncbi:hypothetical protein CC79DRAFT_1358704 [Sarocladium strictum]
MATNNESPSESLDRDFRRAISNFKASSKLTEAEQHECSHTTLEKFETSMAILQRQQAQTRQLQFMRRLEPFIETIKAYGKAIDVFANTSEILSFIWGPMRVVLVIASTMREAFSSVLDAYEQIADQMPILSAYHALYKDRPYMRALLVQIFEDILEFHLSALRFFKQKVWRQIFNAWSRRFLLTVEKLKDNISRHCRLIQNRATLSEYEDAQLSRRKADIDLEELKAANLSRRRDAVLNWLSPAQSNEIHERHTTARFDNPNAGKWLLENAAMKEWLHPRYCPTPLLWLKGKPGAGKTVLASVVIDYLRDLSDTSMVFFYISGDNPARADFLAIARGILSQLVALDTDLIAYFDDERLKTSSAKLDSLRLAKSLMAVALKKLKTSIILDGIDEMPSRDQRKDVCSWFYDLVDSQETAAMADIRCLFISQDDSIARKDLENIPSLEITQKSNKSDIEAFTDRWQSKIEERFGSFADENFQISRIITAKSRGMFIYAKCLLEEIFQMSSREELLRCWAAEQLPRELDELYQRILSRLVDNGPQSRFQMTQRLLSWLCVAKRPLHWHEIQGALSIDAEHMCMSTHDRHLRGNPEDFCGSFIEHHADGTIELVHPTLKRFLIKDNYIALASAHYELCSLSVTYLHFDFINSDLEIADIDDYVLDGSYSFLDYAMSCWVYHLLDWLPESQPQQLELLVPMIFSMLEQHFTAPARAQPIARSLRETLKPMEGSCGYDQLSQAVMWTRKMFASIETQEQSDLLDFSEIVAVVRQRIECLSDSLAAGEQLSRFRAYYGEHVFKCSRIWCFLFSSGFKRLKSRDAHVLRHDRPFLCPFENCPNATFSCASKRDLSAHLLEIHHIAEEVDEFPQVSNPGAGGGKRGEAKYICPQCDQGFTRKHVLREHLGGHPGELPYFCRCSKAFATSSENKTHREEEHFDGERFVCQGRLETEGEQWGCNRRFRSFETLKEHWRSKECLSNSMKARLKEHVARNLMFAPKPRADSYRAHKSGLGDGLSP